MEEELGRLRHPIEAGATRAELLSAAATPARNAVDAALWDLEAQTTGRSVWEVAAKTPVEFVDINLTIGIGSPREMALQSQAAIAQGFRMLKVKLDSVDCLERLQAIRTVAPTTGIFVDANASWSFEYLKALMPGLVDLGIKMVEQPLNRASDGILQDFDSPIPLFCDESFNTSKDLAVVAKRYDGVNIKLDKCGGLTEALRIVEGAKSHDLSLMVGCMGGTSLAMAPAYIIAADCQYRDIDCPLGLKLDRTNGMRFEGGRAHLFARHFWG
jgi:L-Ala-D/L-Glu epimerase